MKNLLLALSLLTLSANAEDAPDVAAARKLVAATVYKVSAGNSLVNPYGEKEYKARVDLEIALKKINKDFLKTHESYVQARAKSTDSEAEKKAYYKEMEQMVTELRSKAEAEPKLAEKVKAWNTAIAAKEDFIGAELAKQNPTQAEAYKKALAVIRGGK
jgi:hypothetical protein